MSDLRATPASADPAGQDPCVYLKSLTHAVLLGGAVPETVLSLLKYNDTALASVAGSVHPPSGYAALAAGTHVYVWNYGQTDPHNTAASVPYYTFPIAASPAAAAARNYAVARTRTADAPPFVNIVAKDAPASFAAQDVGLLVTARDGQVRFWQHVAYGLASADSYHGCVLALEAGDHVAHVVACQPVGYLATTHQGRLFKLSLFNDQGKPYLSAQPLERPMGVLSRVTSSLLGYVTQVVDEAAGDGSPAVAATVPGEAGEFRQSRELFVLTRRLVQKWAVSRSFGDAFLTEVDVYEPITQALAERYRIDEAQVAALRLRLLDFQLTRTGRWVILIGYIRDAATSRHLAATARTHYALVELEPTTTPQPTVVQVRSLRYTDGVDGPGGRETPTLVIPQGGQVAAVLFGQSVVLTTLAPGVTFEEVIAFRDNHVCATAADLTLRAALKLPSHRYLAHAVPWLADPAAVVQLTVACVTSGVLDVYCHLPAIATLTRPAGTTDPHADGTRILPSATERQRRQYTQIKGTLEQAVFFGTTPTNPLEFTVARASAQLLEEASLNLSQEVVDSRSPYIPPAMELRQQLHERVTRANALAHFLHAQSVMGQISLAARYRLCENAQKLAVALTLWNYRNSLVSYHQDAAVEDDAPGDSQKHPALKLLTAALDFIPNLPKVRAEGPLDPAAGPVDVEDLPEDPLRRFFCLGVAHLEPFLCGLRRAFASLAGPDGTDAPLRRSRRRTTTAGSGSGPAEQRGHLLYELNRMLMMSLQTAQLYRQDYGAAYALDAPSDREPWYATDDMYRLLQAVFNTGVVYVRQLNQYHDDAPPTEGAEYVDESDVYRSPRALWSVLKNQLVYLGDLVLDTYRQRVNHVALPPDTREALAGGYAAVVAGVVDPLVEFGRTDAGLALAEAYHAYALLVRLVFAHEPTPATRLATYVEQFGKPFAFALYDWYVTEQRFYDLLDHGRRHGAELDQYLERHPELTPVAWLHDLHQRRPDEVAARLLRTAESLTTDADPGPLRTALSLGKLAQLSSATLGDLDDPAAAQVLAPFDDRLDVSRMAEKVRQMYVDAFAALDDYVPKRPEERARLVAQQLAPQLVGTSGSTAPAMTALSAYYVTLVGRALRAAPLDGEGLLDLLTLKDVGESPGEAAPDFILALELLRRDTSLSTAGFEYGILTVWRRVYLADDWPGIHRQLVHASDEELTATLADTLLFNILAYARQQGLPEQCLVSPAEAAGVAEGSGGKLSLTYLQTRLAADEPPPCTAEALATDLQAEMQRLAAILKPTRLGTYHREVVRLVDAELQINGGLGSGMVMDSVVYEDQAYDDRDETGSMDTDL
ncbi:hypothetical protein IWQ60_007949 [Tieghemiomyces parasiticus]|uniref:Nucleoporin Nup133/Nup155-like N-terminal domain-containing protein n=1 Tax=Tieghemiomyces parasiticus TaxID=78921 RepID=A0A9W7ZUK1_9FUNG|nr:hypothetical protein IWQ60_007949 [Tieghemiomyces parasiticus]